MAADEGSDRRSAAGASRTGRDAVDAVNDAWAAVDPEFGTVELALSRRTARLFGMLDEVLLARLAPLGITRAEFLVLTGLRAVGAPHQLRPTDLTARLLLSSGGTTNVL